MSSFKLGKLAAADTGACFYPVENRPVESKASQIKEDETLEEALDRSLFQTRGTFNLKLNPMAIFKSVTEAAACNLAPEQTITLFALRLAMIEKVASGIGTLAFVWASTIILGGFASNINTVDFIVVAIILTTEGTRIFSRSRELEWQHMASKSSRSDTSFQVVQQASPDLKDDSSSSSRYDGMSGSRRESLKEQIGERSKVFSRQKSRFSRSSTESTGEKNEIDSEKGVESEKRPVTSFQKVVARRASELSNSSICENRAAVTDVLQEKVETPTAIDVGGLKKKKTLTRTNSMQIEMRPLPVMAGNVENRLSKHVAFAESAHKFMQRDTSASDAAENAEHAEDSCTPYGTGSDSNQLRLRKFSSEPQKVLQRSLGSINIKNVHLKSVEEENNGSMPRRSNSCRPELVTSFRPTIIKDVTRTWSSEVVPVLPGGMSKILSNAGVVSILCSVQLSSAIICLVLSGWRISQQEFDPPHVMKEERPVNFYMCVNLFYILALLEAFLFLLERGYWEYKLNYEQLILEVNNKAGLGVMGHEILRQFFYEVYKKCIEGSVFDGLEMDLVEFSLALLQSENTLDQLGALRLLHNFVDRNDGSSADALRRIGTTPGVIERLVEMLSWRSAHHGDILQEVAELVWRAMRFGKNCVRISAVPGSMDMIVSLVKSSEKDRTATSIIDKSLMYAQPSTVHNISALRLNGLRILVAQARDPANLLKIGEARGLVPALVSLISIRDVQKFKNLKGPTLKTFKKVLRLLAMLVGARNVSGTVLRPIIARVVSCIASMRDILEFGKCHPQLQWMAIEILTNLALDNDIRVAIGGTGGIIRNLLTLYISGSGGSGTFLDSDEIGKVRQAVSKRAGEALNFLAIQNRKNCSRMMELELNGKRAFIPALIKLLNDQKEQAVLAAKILRSLMDYADDAQQREIARCAPRLMRLLIGSTNLKLSEAVTGLVPRVVGFLEGDDYNQVVEMVDRAPLIRKLLMNLDHDHQKFTAFPRTRRYTIECILALVKRDPIFLDEFTRQGLLENKLVKTLDNICEVENFLTFSGTEGLTRYPMSVEDLVRQTLLELRLLVAQRRQSRYEAIQLIIIRE